VRVGMVTFHHVTNIGAVLQAYALARVMREFGCDVRVIDYRPEYLVGAYRRLGRHPLNIGKGLVRSWRYRRFRQTFIPTTERIYRTADELRSAPPDLDACVCGSDQVWNLRIQRYRADRAFFLAFGAERMKRIAYAPSVGDVVSLGDELRREIAGYIGAFEAVSAREEDARTFIRELTGRDAPLVLDPSLLLGDYAEVTKEPRRSPARYVLVYPMDYSDEFRGFVRDVRQVLQLPTVNVGTRPMAEADFNSNDLGPGEWLGWMKNASFVCTDSFHGMTYAIVFRRDFVSFPHQRTPALNARMRDTLLQLGLEERFASPRVAVDGDSPYLQPVKYGAMEPLLRSRVADSRQYLRNALFEHRSKAGGA
jgi:hypothetical protein